MRVKYYKKDEKTQDMGSGETMVKKTTFQMLRFEAFGQNIENTKGGACSV